ncbi:hypothetical protein [Streptosporangium sp. NPDC002524]|uniref:hypothetical protein n=1 Tax=Streptosporangium sp. NPDC002524 TaxID=3154537 RepID=UPI003318E279
MPPAQSLARRTGRLRVCLALVATARVLSLAVSTRNIGPHTVWDALFRFTGTDEQASVRDLRVSRTVLSSPRHDYRWEW